MTNSDFARHMAEGEKRRQNTDYEAIETRIMEKLKKLPSYDLDWVECMINHLIARTQQPPEPAKMAKGPTPLLSIAKPPSGTGGQSEPFQGQSKNPMPLGGESCQKTNTTT